MSLIEDLFNWIFSSEHKTADVDENSSIHKDVDQKQIREADLLCEEAENLQKCLGRDGSIKFEDVMKAYQKASEAGSLRAKIWVDEHKRNIRIEGKGGSFIRKLPPYF